MCYSLAQSESALHWSNIRRQNKTQAHINSFIILETLQRLHVKLKLTEWKIQTVFTVHVFHQVNLHHWLCVNSVHREATTNTSKFRQSFKWVPGTFQCSHHVMEEQVKLCPNEQPLSFYQDKLWFSSQRKERRGLVREGSPSQEAHLYTKPNIHPHVWLH